MMADSHQYRRHVALYPLLAAFVLRLVWGIAIPIIPISDSVAYDAFAWNIAQGYGYGWQPYQPTAYWPVGASAIYAFIYWLFGHHYLPVMLLQVAVGVAIVALAMVLARRWFDEKTAIFTGWILACWPLLIQYTTLLASELYFILFVLLAFWFASMPGRHWVVRAALSGIALAAASYVRPLALIMAPLLFASAMIDKRERVRGALACVVATLVMLICILPWTVRNWQVFERVVLISTNGGANLWMGNNPSGSTEYMPIPKLNIANEADADKYLGKQAKDYIVQDPMAFVARAGSKMISLYDRETIGVTWNEKGIKQRLGSKAIPVMKLVSSAYWWLALAGAVFGMILLARSKPIIAFITCPPIGAWGYFTLVHGVTVAGDRYHVPSVVFVAMLASSVICLTKLKI